MHKDRDTIKNMITMNSIDTEALHTIAIIQGFSKPISESLKQKVFMLETGSHYFEMLKKLVAKYGLQHTRRKNDFYSLGPNAVRHTIEIQLLNIKGNLEKFIVVYVPGKLVHNDRIMGYVQITK